MQHSPELDHCIHETDDCKLARAVDFERPYFSLEKPDVVDVHCKAVDALQYFRNDDHIMAIPVVDSHMQPVGLITRKKVLMVFGHQFSFELNCRKKVTILMDENPLIFTADADIDSISRAMTERSELHVFDPAIMTLNGQYCGLLSVITLLKRMTDIRIELAFDSNPLSRLPGNNSINREIDTRLLQSKSFMLAYIDLDNFKAFNDYYGYERGDRVIQLLANILKDVAVAVQDFVGHIGGDDFVMLLEPADWRGKAEVILERFSFESGLMYNVDDRDRGFIISENRQGQPMQFPLMSLSIAAVPCDADIYESHVAVAEVASEIKHLAKKEAGNSIVVNRRESF